MGIQGGNVYVNSQSGIAFIRHTHALPSCFSAPSMYFRTISIQPQKRYGYKFTSSSNPETSFFSLLVLFPAL